MSIHANGWTYVNARAKEVGTFGKTKFLVELLACIPRDESIAKLLDLLLSFESRKTNVTAEK